MSEATRIDLELVLPQIDAADQCIDRLSDLLRERKGIEHAHITRDDDTAELCIHFDPHRISLEQVRRLAQEAGIAVTDRYRHDQIPFAGLDAADTADGVTRELEHMPGVIHANVNYAAGLAFVAYDSMLQKRADIETRLRQLGVRLVPQPGREIAAAPTGTPEHAREGDHEDHDHGSAPAFLPHWMQERWTLVLVALAGLFLLIGWAGETYFGLPPTIALVLYVLAYLAGGYDVATHALPGLLRGKFNTDVLMLAAAAGAAILGEWTEGAFLLFLFALGHAGEHYALDRARNAVNALGELMPQVARVRRNEQIVELPIGEVQIEDVVVIRPGDRVPVDGVVASGTSTVDQSPITGESVPVEKTPGSEVFAGTINQDGALDVRVARLARDNTLSRVMKLVAEAQSQQSP
ncbi:MAG TPA: HAD-IC family P-type ATPase, partial [Roseiflexaceae bacterium]|nr:HAD-IC family P-type ATPase [Roseiflexaceae bacterium]